VLGHRPLSAVGLLAALDVADVASLDLLGCASHTFFLLIGLLAIDFLKGSNEICDLFFLLKSCAKSVVEHSIAEHEFIDLFVVEAHGFVKISGEAADEYWLGVG
jgi:hypothetical protein